MEEEDRKLIVIGLDGATFDFIDYWVERGELPNLEKLEEKGIRADLNSTTPPISPVAWSSFITGTRPDKHGVFSFFEDVHPDLEIVDSRSVKGKPFWEELEDRVKVGVLNLPMTYPPEPLNGFMISGFLSGGRNLSYPDGFLGEVEESIGERYKIDAEVNSKEGRESDTFEEVLGLLENHESAFFHVFEEEDWDLLVNVFMAPDRASHFFWEQRHEKDNPLLRIYREADSVIGKIMEEKDDDTSLIVMSDHGFGRLEKTVNINNFLRENGYIEFGGALSKLKAKIFYSGFNPKNLFDIASKLGLDRLMDRLSQAEKLKKADLLLSYSDLDWESTAAVSIGKGNVYINEDYLEREEIDYSEFREQLISDLEKMEDPETGEEIVKEVLKTEELYGNGNTGDMPDLIVRMEDKSYSAHPLFASNGKILTEHITKGKTGCHRRKGIFLAEGPAFEGGEVEDINIEDLPPTILGFFNESPPDSMDGEVREEIFRGD